MRHLAILAALLCASCFPPAFAAESDDDDEDTEPQQSCPFATGTFADGMENRLVRTVRAGYTRAYRARDRDVADVYVSLEHVLPASWTCATWSVELLHLPTATSLVGASKLTGLTRTSTATFAVKIDHAYDESTPIAAASLMWETEIHVYRVMLAVEVFNGGDAPVHVADRSDGQGRWHYPVDIIYERR